jgi:hypothetical protein
MSLKYLALAAALAVAPAAFAQDTQMQPGAAPQAGETSDRTPEQATPTPQNQKDTADGKTSERSQNKDLKVEHQPGAAGTAGSSSEGASSGDSGETKTPSATPPASSGSK